MTLTPYRDDDDPITLPVRADAETIEVIDAEPGDPVDAPTDVPFTVTWADITSTTMRDRIPIIPAWLRNPGQRSATLRALVANLGYYAAFHATRSPKYVAKLAWYAPVGVFRVGGRLLHWATAEEGNWGLRQNAANTNDAFTWQALNKTRSRESKARWWALGAGAAAICTAGTALAVAEYLGEVMPAVGWYATATGAALLLARAGRPADRRITDRVSNRPPFVKLTADMVRQALISLNLPRFTEPGQVEFVHPGIHRDGPGWLARINLPAGMEAVKVLEKRGGLSSALRLPVDQVWPSAGPEHAGQVDLWVGYQPASMMDEPRWSLASENARTSVFDEHEFGTDERQRPVKTDMFARSFLIGGQPGSGKTYAARAVGTVAALDPTVEFKIAEFKGTGDFLDFEPLCSTYVVGVDDEAFKQGAAILTWALAEAERRGKRILDAKKAGLAPEGKVTPELARRKGSGLHPIVILIDEAHELFAAMPEAADKAERLIKRARALNMIVILATQIPDKTSLPPNITRCVTNRWCLSVAGQVENDMILGTGAYKRGLTGTVYRPKVDSGWGVMTGGPTPISVKSHFPDPATAAAMIAHAIALRGGTVTTADDLPAARDLLSDLADVSASNGQHWTTAALALTDRWPNAYPGLTAEALSSLARTSLGIESRDVKIAGTNLKGYRLADIRDRLTRRIESAEG